MADWFNKEVAASMLRYMLGLVIGAIGWHADPGSIDQIAVALAGLSTGLWALFAASKRADAKRKADEASSALAAATHAAAVQRGVMRPVE